MSSSLPVPSASPPIPPPILPPISSSISPRQILANTSLAVAGSLNGDRRLLFQDQSGNVREAIYSASAGVWRTASNFIVASDAKNSTPIAAVNSLPESEYASTGVGPSTDDYNYEAH